MKRITMRDVAQHAGVSISSVSRYINDPTSINPIPALKIEQSIKELGYIPNTYAQALKSGNSRTVGVVVPTLGPFFSHVCTALSDFFYQHKYLLYICETGEDVEKERYYVNALLGQQVAGLLIALSGRTGEFIADTSRKFPNIVVIDQHEETKAVDAVYEDNFDSAYTITKHMLDKGHKQFVLLYRTEDSTNTPDRQSGTLKAFQEAGLDMRDMDIHFDVRTEEEVYQKLKQSLAGKTGQVAVIGYSPLIMENTIISLNRLGKKVPKEIDLAGYILEDFSSKFGVDIPCVVQKPYELGIHAGDVLLRKLRRAGEKAAPRQICLPAEIRFPER